MTTKSHENTKTTKTKITPKIERRRKKKRKMMSNSHVGETFFRFVQFEKEKSLLVTKKYCTKKVPKKSKSVVVLPPVGIP